MRRAFIGDSPLNDPSRAFIKVHFQFHGPVAKADVAYNSEDLERYLIYLKSNKFIGSYLWVDRHGELNVTRILGQASNHARRFLTQVICCELISIFFVIN